MVKQTLLSIFAGVAVLATTVSANPLMDLTYGARVGLNSANTSKGSNDSVTGLFLAGTATHAYSDVISTTAEIQYSVKGFKNGKLNYLEVPVYATYHLPQQVGKFRFHVLGGGYVSYLLGGDKVGSIKPKDAFYDGDYGLLFGAGVSMDCPMREGSITSLDLRYELGLKELSASAGKNKSIQLGLGYTF